MRNLKILVVAVAILGIPAFAPAQIIEALVAYGINKIVAKGEKQDHSTGVIRCNVYLIKKDGTRVQLPGWNPGLGDATWYNVQLEVVPIPHTAKSPRQVEISLTSADGAVIRQWHSGVNGGRRSKGSTYTDNNGYEQGPCVIDTRRLRPGWYGLHSNWGGGAAQPAFFQVLDYQGTLAMIVTDHEVRDALAGSGLSTNPLAPLMTIVTDDGKIYSALSKEDAQKFTAGLNQNAPKTIPVGMSSAGSGQLLHHDGRENGPVSQRETSFGFEVRRDFYNKADIWERFRDATKCEEFLRDALMDGPAIEASDQIEIDRRHNLAVLITSNKPFEVELGRERFPVRRGAQGYECLLTLKYSSSSSATRLIVKQDGRTRQFRFKEVGQ